MPRPDFITEEDIARWSYNIDNDDNLPKEFVNSPLIREVCYAGLWLSEELDKADCPESIVTRIQYTAGKIAFGRDIWDVHQGILAKYKTGELVFEDEEEETVASMRQMN